MIKIIILAAGKGKRITKAKPTILFEALQKLQKEANKNATIVAIPQKTPILEPSIVNAGAYNNTNKITDFFDKSFINPPVWGG